MARIGADLGKLAARLTRSALASFLKSGRGTAEFTMTNQTVQFFVSLMFLFGGLQNFVTALSNGGPNNSFVARNQGIFVAVLLAIAFGLGW